MRRSRSAAFALSRFALTRFARSTFARSTFAFSIGVVALAPNGARAQAQPALPMQGMEHEQAGRWREALTAYRASLDASLVASILGIERVYDQLGKRDSIVPLIDTLIARRPREPTLRTIQLRTLVFLKRDEAAAAAFERWAQLAPREAAPYREYARLLLDEGRASSADTVLQRAQRALGGTRDLTVEMAQLRAATGLWELSAQSWRDALATSPYLDQAAVFSLFPTPDSLRAAVRQAFSAPPLQVEARKALALLELRWGSARAGWLALRDLPPADDAVQAWTEFGDEAEAAGAWLVARDAFAAALARKQSRELAVRAANDALSGGEPASAAALLEPYASHTDAETMRTVLPVRVRALSALGRASEAEALIDAASPRLDSLARVRLVRLAAWGWVRAGNLARARAALGAPTDGDDDDRTLGWIALYEGDLQSARRILKRSSETDPELVLALALLGRTRADTAPLVGEAFLALARGDSVAAVAKLQSAAPSVPDAGALLLGAAARILDARHDDSGAVRLWQRITEEHATAPEAPEAELEWARALRRRGDTAAAVKRLEHMILTYPRSALVPQARRELDLVRQSVPPS
jgi:tetratricopeptide (TPR) repeat protein